MDKLPLHDHSDQKKQSTLPSIFPSIFPRYRARRIARFPESRRNTRTNTRTRALRRRRGGRYFIRSLPAAKEPVRSWELKFSAGKARREPGTVCAADYLSQLSQERQPRALRTRAASHGTAGEKDSFLSSILCARLGRLPLRLRRRRSLSCLPMEAMELTRASIPTFRHGETNGVAMVRYIRGGGQCPDLLINRQDAAG